MRSPYEFIVGKHQYQGKPMPADRQLQVSRRILPLIAGLLPTISAQFKKTQERRMAAEKSGEELPSLQDILSTDMSLLIPGLQSAVQALADLPDEQFQYIKNVCLSQVSRLRPGDTGWMPIWNEAAQRLQFEDLEGHEIFLIVTEVLKREVGPFFLGLVTELIGDSLL